MPQKIARKAHRPLVAIVDGQPGVEFLQRESLRGEAVVDIKLQPPRGHDGDLVVELRHVALAGGAAEVEISRQVEDHQVPRPVDGIPRLERVVEFETHGVGRVELVHIAQVAQAQRLEVRAKRLPVDRRDVGLALVRLRDVTVQETRGHQVADAVNPPGLVLVVIGRAGAKRGIEAHLTERPGVGAASTGGLVVVGQAAAGNGREGQPRLRGERAAERVIGVEAGALQRRPAGGRFLAQGHHAGVEALGEAVADREREEVKAQLGEAFLDGMEGVGLEPAERGNEVIVPGVD